MSPSNQFARLDNLSSDEENDEESVSRPEVDQREDNLSDGEIQHDEDSRDLEAEENDSFQKLHKQSQPDSLANAKRPPPMVPKRQKPINKISSTNQVANNNNTQEVEHKLCDVNFEDSDILSGTSFWDDHNRWKASVQSNGLMKHVKVKDPETSPRSLTSITPVVYYIVCVDNDNNSAVKRRYSDFEWLQELLQARYVGMMIPPLAPKKPGAGMSFLNHRMRGLTLFLEKLLDNPYLKSDTTVELFLKQATADEWELTKKKVGPFARDKLNEGQERWLHALAMYELPKDSKQVIAEVTKEVDLLDDQLSRILSASQNLCLAMEAQTDSLSEFNNKFKEVQHAGTLPDGSAERTLLSDSLSDFSNCVSNWTEAAKREQPIVDYLVNEAIRFELGLVVRVKELLRQRREVIRLHDKSVQKRIQHEREKASIENTGNSEKLYKLQRKLQEDQERIKNTYDHAIYLTKGLFYSGFRSFTEIKAKRLVQLKDTLAAAYIEHHKRMVSVWEDSLSVSSLMQGNNGSVHHV